VYKDKGRPVILRTERMIVKDGPAACNIMDGTALVGFPFVWHSRDSCYGLDTVFFVLYRYPIKQIQGFIITTGPCPCYLRRTFFLTSIRQETKLI